MTTTAPLTPAEQDAFHARLRTIGVPSEHAHRFDEDRRDNLEAYVDGHAANTLRCLRLDLGRWFSWCAGNGADPFAPTARQVRDYLRAFGGGRHPDSIKRMLSNVCVFVTRIAGSPNTTTGELVKGEISKASKARGSAHGQVAPIRRRGDVIEIDDEPELFSIDRMTKALEPYTVIREVRSRFILSLGGDTGRRGDEYRAANMGHIHELKDGQGFFTIPASKTDQMGEGVVKLLSLRTMRYYREWRSALAERGVDVGRDTPLIRCINAHGTVGGRLWRAGFTYVVRVAVREAMRLIDAGQHVIDYEALARRVSGHSFRVGLAQDLTAAGEDLPSICNEGGWKDTRMPLRYAAHLATRSGAMARLRKRLGDA